MHSVGERAGNIPTSSDHAIVSSSKKYTAKPKYRYAIRVTAVLIAILGDISLISAAALTAALVRFHSLSNVTADDFLRIIVPAYLLAAVALDCYRLNTLRRSFASVGRAVLALAIAAGLAFSMAFAFKVGAFYSRLETVIMLGTAAAYLTVGHVLKKVVLDRFSRSIYPPVSLLGPAFVSMASIGN